LADVTAGKGYAVSMNLKEAIKVTRKAAEELSYDAYTISNGCTEPTDKSLKMERVATALRTVAAAAAKTLEEGKNGKV
jgi:prefoldin subunit 5